MSTVINTSVFPAHWASLLFFSAILQFYLNVRLKAVLEPTLGLTSSSFNVIVRQPYRPWPGIGCGQLPSWSHTDLGHEPKLRCLFPGLSPAGIEGQYDLGPRLQLLQDTIDSITAAIWPQILIVWLARGYLGAPPSEYLHPSATSVPLCVGIIDEALRTLTWRRCLGWSQE